MKQGDPISALLFIAVLQECFSDPQKKWARLNGRRTGPRFGLELKSGGIDLTNLRFADDVILVAQSRGDIRKMLQDLSAFAAGYGLHGHFGKTRILTWKGLSHPHTSISIDGKDVRILEEEQSERYLEGEAFHGKLHGI